MVQKCFATHGLRIKRHNALVHYLIRSLNNRGFSTHLEPSFKINEATLKPDIVAYSPDKVFVIDAQVINDQYNLDEAHENKINKCLPLVPQLDRLRSGGCMVSSLTINWRGCFSPGSCKDLLAWRLINKRDLKILSLRAMVGTIGCWRAHQKMTSVHADEKKGVG